MALQTKNYSVTAKSYNDLNTYTYILRVIENSVNKDANTSNLTIKAIVKCGTANILEAITMVVSCTLNGTQVFSNSAQRTLGDANKEHVFYTWTGDVEHDIDGNLTLTVGGKLTHKYENESGKLWMPVTPMTIKEDINNAMQLEYIERGIVYIGNGSEYKAYQCFIHDGTQWKQHLPHLDNGAAFVLSQ